MTAVLVTGGAGYIGSVTCLRLREAGYEVHCLDNLSSGHRDAVPAGVHFIQADLADTATLRAAITDLDIAAVVHFAGAIEPSLSMTNPLRFYRENLVRSYDLVEILVNSGRIPLVYSSTCAVYGQPDRTPVDETVTLSPDSVYGRTKLAVEGLLSDCWAAHGQPSIALRYFNACGALPQHGLGPDHLRKVHLVTQVMLTALGQRPELVVYGGDYDTPDGTCVRDYIHVDDLAGAHVLAVKSLLEQPRSTAYNLGLGKGFSVLEILKSAEAVVGRDIPHTFGPRRAGDPARVFADAAKAHAELAWQPRWVELSDVLTSAWDWHRAHPSGYAR
jgi:UDP-glucose 4-epimerase